MRHLHRLLRWLRITDEDGILSLTHAFVVFACLVYWRHPDATTAATAAAAVANYAVKRELLRRASRAQVENDSAPKLDDLDGRLGRLEGAVENVNRDLAGFKSGQAWAGVLKQR